MRLLSLGEEEGRHSRKRVPCPCITCQNQHGICALALVLQGLELSGELSIAGICPSVA